MTTCSSSLVPSSYSPSTYSTSFTTNTYNDTSYTTQSHTPGSSSHCSYVTDGYSSDSDSSSVTNEYTSFPPSCSPSTISTARPPCQCILQWNIGGLDSTWQLLQEDLVQNNVCAALLQEPQTTYRRNEWTPKELAKYRPYVDRYRKTLIYVREDIDHEHIPLKPPPHQDARNIMHGTAVLIFLTINTHLQATILLNLYRSPSGKAPTTGYLHYLPQIQQYLTRRPCPIHQVEWIIGGDLNASHPNWGGYPQHHKKG
jgi:hypothetical protein